MARAGGASGKNGSSVLLTSSTYELLPRAVLLILPPQVSQIQHALDSRTGADDSLKVAALDFIARPGCHGATARLHSLLPNRSWFTPSHSDGISG